MISIWVFLRNHLSTYETFLSSVQELNEIAEHFLDSNGKQLVFTVKKGSDGTVFWKATVRVAIVKIDAHTKQIDTYRCGKLHMWLYFLLFKDNYIPVFEFFSFYKNSILF